MAVQRSLWRPFFPAVPSWPCPTCRGSGHLRLIKDTLHDIETGPSKHAHSHDAWDPEWIETRFVCLLECNNAECGEIATLCGRTDLIEYFYWDDDGNPGQDYSARFWPIYISPAPHIFRIPEECPEDVQAAINAGFALFWSDRDGCANKWRIAIELLLTHLGIPRYYKRIKGSPLRSVPLHARIQEFGKQNRDAAACFEAVKWLGNHASHAGRDLKDDDIIQAAEILEHALAEIFKPVKSPLRVAKKINKKKGPISKP